MAYFLKNRKPTKEAEELLDKANPEDVKALSELYIKYVKTPGKHEWHCCGVINENEVLEDSEYEVVAAPFTSVYGGCRIFNYGDQFVNVIGSNQDINTDANGTSWISLMKIVYRVLGLNIDNLNTCCSQEGVTRVNPENGTQYVFNHNCSNNIVGAHITNQVEGLYEELQPGNQNVYILPLCRSLNSSHNVIMAANRKIVAIHLNNYRQ